jgi:hypothetical protein
MGTSLLNDPACIRNPFEDVVIDRLKGTSKNLQTGSLR